MRPSSATPLLSKLAALPVNRWFAYGSVLLVQLRGLWGVWEKDLTGGDTSSYFANALLWSGDLQVNVAWSPLYTAFLGTIEWVLGDAVASVHLHRVLIVLALAVVVLALLRRLVPPWAALIGALWWASLPIVYDSLYEVHLFAALPLLFAALLLTNDPSPARRGAAVGFLLAAAVLVRNEAGFVAILILAAMLLAELRRRRAGEGVPIRRLAVAFGVPVLIALALLGLAFERSAIKGEELSNTLDRKHTRNVCQVYTFSYVQRHPGSFDGSPWTECEQLMVRFFDEPEPTLVEAWRQNPGEMLDFTSWNLRMLPQGVQLGLFNAAAGGINPDYARSRLNTWWAGVLSVLLAALLAAGAVFLRRDWERWRPLLLRQRWAWLALAAIAVVVLAVVILTQRPRPSYMFGLSVGLIACAMLALAVLARRFGLARPLAAAATLLPLLLLVALPVHYEEVPTPNRDAYERLSEAAQSRPPDSAQEVIVASASAPNLCQYVFGRERCVGIPYPRGGAGLDPGRPLEQALDARGATLLHVDPIDPADERLAEFIESPGDWSVVDSGEGDRGRWVVIAREA